MKVMGYMWIDVLPVGPNGRGGLLRMHWSARKKYFEYWRMLVMSKSHIVSRCLAPARCGVRIHQVRARKLDKDNLYASVKPVMDALVKLRLIWDDSEKWCDLEVTQETGKQYGIQIEVIRDVKAA